MKKQFFQSTIYRIVILVVVLVLPINILTLILSQMVLDKNQEQMAEDFRTTLTWNAENMESIMNSASKRLTYLSFDDSNFISLAKSTDRDDVKQNNQLLTKASSTLKALQSEYPWMDLMYFYFPGVDYLVSAGYPGVPYKDCKEKIRAVIYTEEESSLSWSFDEVDGNSVLIGKNSWNDSYFGTLINLERMLGRLNFGEGAAGKVVFFTNSDETVFTTGGQRYLDEQQMTLAEIRASERYQVFEAEIEKSDLRLVEIVDWDRQMENLPVTIRILQILAIVLTILVIPLLLLYVRKWVIWPVNRLVRGIEKIEAGEIDYRIKAEHTGREFEQINQSFNQMMDQVHDLKIGVYEKELERKNIKMRYLSQQIQSHFILNTMNILYSYEPEEYPLIQKLVLCISKYFQYIVKVEDEFVLLHQEMEHIDNYFEIQKARYPDLFYAIVEYDEELKDALVPPLLVQNFAENSIKHSLKIGNKITIFVVAEKYQDEGEAKIRIRLADTGEGISDEMLEKIAIFRKTGEVQPGMGVGIRNAIERMEHLYWGKTRFYIGRDAHYSGTNVEIILPLHYAKKREAKADEGFINRR